MIVMAVHAPMLTYPFSVCRARLRFSGTGIVSVT
jgi:hypothetical protein